MLFKYNTSLLAFDRSSIVADSSEFKFLPFIQSIQIDSNLEKISQKSIGKDALNKKIFTNPNFNLNITSIQENNFLLERLIGLFINNSPEDQNTILYKFDSKFINKAFMLFNDNLGEDILFKIRTNGYSEDLISFVFNKLFLNSYSFSYKAGELPITNLLFSFDDILISNITRDDNFFYAQDPLGDNIKLESSWIESFYFKTNTNIKEKINNTAVDFELTTDYLTLEVPSSDFSILSSSNIQSMDFSLDFQRNKFYFFEKGMNPLDRPYLMPCIGKFSIQGLTSQFNKKSLSSLKSSDSKFSIVLRFGKAGNLVNYSEIKFENVTVDNFSYSMSLDGFLNYSIDCSIEINENSGAKFTLLEVSDQDENFFKLFSSDDHKLRTVVKNPIFAGNGNFQIAKIGQNINVNVADLFGSAIALNGNGDTVAIGAPKGDAGGFTDSGYVRVYYFNGTIWTQLGATLIGAGTNDNFGTSIDINLSGNRILVGAKKLSGLGYIKVFYNNGSDWVQLGQTLLSNSTTNVNFGTRVSMNDSGNIIAFTAQTGAVAVYELFGNFWYQKGLNIAPFGFATGWGTGLSLNGSGDTLAIGVSSNIVRVYYWSGFSWERKGVDIIGQSGLNFGEAISLNQNGNVLAIGFPRNNGGNPLGYVKVYSFNGSTWTQMGANINGEALGDKFGTSVALNSSGTRLVVGAPGNDGLVANSELGAIYVYSWNGSSWIKIASASGENNGDKFGGIDLSLTSQLGIGVAINSVGNIVAGSSIYSSPNSVRSYQLTEDQVIVGGDLGDLVVLG
jgi:hypothetical protein